MDHLHVESAFPARRRDSARGSTMVELAMMLSVAVPLLMGIVGVGLRLGRTLSATQVTRDVAHMYALGADFSLPGAKNIAAALSRDFRLTTTGNAVLILSRIVKVYQTDCQANNLSNCPNQNLTVFTQRLVIGNSSLRSSNFGTPPPNYVDVYGNIKPADYLKLSALTASGFDAVLTLQQGESAKVVEGYFSMPELNLLHTTNGGGYYVRLLF